LPGISLIDIINFVPRQRLDAPKWGLGEQLPPPRFDFISKTELLHTVHVYLSIIYVNLKYF